jgi:hypothetical protein
MNQRSPIFLIESIHELGFYDLYDGYQHPVWTEKEQKRSTCLRLHDNLYAPLRKAFKGEKISVFSKAFLLSGRSREPDESDGLVLRAPLKCPVL